MKRAREILKEIEEDGRVAPTRVERVEPSNTEVDLFTAALASKDSEACDRLREVDLNTLTPIEAMNLLFELKKIISD